MMGKVIALCAAIGFCQPDVPVEWKHGYKTDYVVAWRFKNEMIGYNIGFDLPKNPYDADRAEMFEWLGKEGVMVFQGGGSPGARLYAKVKGVEDRDSANVFLQSFVPKFSKWIRDNLN